MKPRDKSVIELCAQLRQSERGTAALEELARALWHWSWHSLDSANQYALTALLHYALANPSVRDAIQAAHPRARPRESIK